MRSLSPGKFILVIVLSLIITACSDNSATAPVNSSVVTTSQAQAAFTATPVKVASNPNTLTPPATFKPGTSPAPAKTGSSSTTGEREAAADAYFNQGQFDKAEEAYKTLLANDPANVGLLLKLAIAQLAQLKDADALNSLDKASKADPNNPLPYVYLGQYYQEKQQYDKAISYLEKAVQLEPKSAELNYYLGEAYYFGKRYKDAASAYVKARELAPDVAVVHARLALTYFNLNQFAESEAEYKQAISLDATDAVSLNNLAYLYIEQGRFDEARDPLAKAEKLGLGGKDYFEQTKLGLLIPEGQKEEANGNPDKAAEIYKKAAEAQNSLGYYYLGKLEQGRNRQDAAAEAFNNYLKLGKVETLKQEAEVRLKQMGKVPVV